MLVGLLLLIIFLCLVDYWAKKPRNDMMKNIPTVRNLPIIGAVSELASFNAENLASKFEIFRKKYGKAYKSWIAHTLILNTSDPKHVEAILSSSKHISKHRLYLMLREWLGQGLLLSDGTKWQNMRKIITPTFHFKILEEFVEVFDQQSTILVEKLKPKADGITVIDVYPLICLMALDIIAETAMGTQIQAQKDENTRYVKAVNDVTDILAMRFMKPHLTLKKTFKFFKPKLSNKQLEGILYMHLFTNRIIEDRRKSLNKSKTGENGSDENIENLGIKKRMAFLDVLLQSTTSNGEPLSDEDIREEVDTFMFEGHDTTTSAISFTLRAVACHPEVQKKLFEEVKELFGADLDKPITYRDIHGMKYMNCVIKESLRLFPPIPAIGRFIREDLELYNCTIPANTNVIIILWEILRDSDIYEDPLAFKPERHLENNPKSNTFSYIPFSAGPRNCIGQKFALVEIKCVLIKILRHFELLPLGEDVHPSIKIVLRSKTGVNLGLRPRIY
ncbi:cytochrome P450 4d2-like [Eupeodes corollae]|uniref:cytochrome P450 4d2-like n=1 Tax=Eupeodes corollae TaxID=290404 RepID=UPI0024926066|nr:cytochrome P450 4d2-like [Eupeodes corollae]XP_055923181.1 cytochrome P450 4d2-like [Eupeodes corollae]XP_055923182.1 cytochrome P450 4d2-like [Eupeodes corollae]XP_055923183.1 cytochrome P450 4d2-like [Eupeodes corollae]